MEYISEFRDTITYTRRTDFNKGIKGISLRKDCLTIWNI